MRPAGRVFETPAIDPLHEPPVKNLCPRVFKIKSFEAHHLRCEKFSARPSKVEVILMALLNLELTYVFYAEPFIQINLTLL